MQEITTDMFATMNFREMFNRILIFLCQRPGIKPWCIFREPFPDKNYENTRVMQSDLSLDRHENFMCLYLRENDLKHVKSLLLQFFIISGSHQCDSYVQ